MRRTILVTLPGFILAGCLEKVDPISNIENLSPAAFGAGSVALTWQPPTTNADGSPLMDLSGYTIYVGTDSNDYTFREIRLDNPGLTAYVVENLAPGTYYFAATAFNSAGVESAFSAEIEKTIEE
jgi:hypothetical protein